MSTSFTAATHDSITVVEFSTESLMDPMELERMGAQLFDLVDVEGQRKVVLDFTRVLYVSSQALGIIMAMRKRLAAVKPSKFVLCGLCASLQQLLKISGVEKLLIIKSTQAEALKAAA